MWTKSYSTVTKAVTKEQMWKLFADVDNWHTWDQGVEFAKLDGQFKKGNFFTLKPKGGPKIKIELVQVEENKVFMDLTRFPLAKMYGEHTFEDTPDGLKITITMRVEGLLKALWIKLVAQDIVNNLPKDVENQIKTASKL